MGQYRNGAGPNQENCFKASAFGSIAVNVEMQMFRTRKSEGRSTSSLLRMIEVGEWLLRMMEVADEAANAASERNRILFDAIIDIAQRNINASFGLMKRQAAARTLGEVLHLQAISWHSQFYAALRQGEQLRALSAEIASDVARSIQDLHSIDDGPRMS